MKSSRLLGYLLLVAILVSTLGITQTAKAVSISPLTFELAANPGEIVSNVLKVTNTEQSPLNVIIEVEDFAAIGEEGQVTLQPDEDNSTYSLANWVTVSPGVFTIPGRGSEIIEFTVNLPIDAEPGGHYASILASVSGSAPGGSGPSVAQKVGSLVLMNVAGDVKEQLHIAEFSAKPFSEYGPVTITSRFENDGTVHLKPRGFILIKNFFGQEVAKLDLPQRNVLPRSIRRIEEQV